MICNTWSNSRLTARISPDCRVCKRGVWRLGIFLSISRDVAWRDKHAAHRDVIPQSGCMDVEESSGGPDGRVVLCVAAKDNTILVMGAASCDVPALVVRAAQCSMASTRGGTWFGTGFGANGNWLASERAGFHGSRGLRHMRVCADLGTAQQWPHSRALGLALPHNAVPAVDSRRYALAHAAGRRIVGWCAMTCVSRTFWRNKLSERDCRKWRRQGLETVIHLSPMPGRWYKDYSGRLGPLGPRGATLVDLMPSGRFLMEDFYYAGGLPAVIRALVQRNLIHCDALTVNGNTIWENCQAAPNWNPEVIRPLERPLVERGGIVVLRGNLAQDGAVLKPSAASPHLIGIADALWYSRISNTTRSGSTTPTWKSTRIAFSY